MDDITALENEYGLVHLFYHRNRNQFRAQEWWRHLDLVHRHVRRILEQCLDVQETEDSKQASAIVVRWDKQGRQFKVVVGASTPSVGVLKRQIVKRARYVVRKVVPAAYRSFMNVIQLGQFVAVGFTLVGLLSRIRALLSKMIDDETASGEIVELQPASVSASAEPLLTKNSVADSITVASSTAIGPKPIKASFKPKPKAKKNKSKKKTAKSAMDDIFG